MFLVSVLGELQIERAGLLRLLLAHMVEVHGVRHGRELDRTIGPGAVPVAGFPNAATDFRHWLPVGRFEAQLHLVELVADVISNGFRKGTQTLACVSVEPYRL